MRFSKILSVISLFILLIAAISCGGGSGSDNPVVQPDPAIGGEVVEGQIDCSNPSSVLICHIPPGNPENVQDICVVEPAVAAHLVHGDYLGSCNSEDSDKDDVLDDVDNCPEVANLDQSDLDGDNIGDVCDPDIDGDGVLNVDDAFPNDPNESVDTDGDGIGDNADPDDDNDGIDDDVDIDSDGDGVNNNVDNCPDVANADQADTDGDGVGDVCDTDTNGGDTTAPVVTTSSLQLLTNSTSATFVFSSNEADSTFTCKLDNAAFVTCVSPYSLNGLAEGSHSLTIKATDLTGNVSEPASYNWTIDLSKPTITITEAPSNLANKADAQFIFSSSEAGTTFTCKIDGQASVSCISPFSTGLLVEGTHTVEISGKDMAGNASTPASYSWSIDLTRPTITSVTPLNAASNVSANTEVTTLVSEVLAPSTVSAETVTLVDENNQPVMGSVSIHGKVITFQPTAVLTRGIVYTATLTTGIMDQAGNELAANYTWSFTTQMPFQLNVALSGVGNGHVTSDVGEINCTKEGGVCTTMQINDGKVVLTATPDEGSVFGGWFGYPCSGTGPCTISLDQDRSVRALFVDRIVYVSGKNIWIKNVDGSNAVALTNLSEAAAWSPMWSPDGSKIIFVSDRALDGSDKLNVGKGVCVDQSGWVDFPDAMCSIPPPFCVAQGGVASNVWVIGADGAGDTALTKMESNVRTYAQMACYWGPDEISTCVVNTDIWDLDWSQNGTQIILKTNSNGASPNYTSGGYSEPPHGCDLSQTTMAIDFDL